jgi:hypothetical protein
VCVCLSGWLERGFTLNSTLAIVDATECAGCSSFLSAVTEAPKTGNAIVRAPVSGFRWPRVAAK